MSSSSMACAGEAAARPAIALGIPLWSRKLPSLVIAELRMQWRSPVWAVGLLAALLVVYTETGSGLFGWPTINHALNGFQEACTKVIVIVAFLITLSSVTRDYYKTRSDILFSRPFHLGTTLAAKFAAGVTVSLTLVAMLILTVYGRLLLGGASTTYETTPFSLAIVFCTIPAILYTCGLAALLGVVCRRLTVALAIFLAYFAFAVSSAGHNWDVPVSMADFTMSLKPERCGITLHEMGGTWADLSFSRYFSPLSTELITRGVLYTLLSFTLLGAAGIIMETRRRTRS